MNAHNIEKLTMLHHSTITGQLVTNQHTIVLDNFIASQGGICQVVGLAYCHYVDSSGLS